MQSKTEGVVDRRAVAPFDTNKLKLKTKTVKERLLLTHYCFLPKLRSGDQASEEREHDRRERDDGGILIYHRVDFPLKSKQRVIGGDFSCLWEMIDTFLSFLRECIIKRSKC